MTYMIDVLIVGGGGAGLRAAIAVAEEEPALKVAVASKVYPMRSHTVSAEGGAAGVIGLDDTLDEHCYDTISGGDWLPDQDAVEAFVAEAPRELMRLEHWGCPWSREPDGRVAVRPFGGMKKMRTWYAADKTGFHLLHTLFQTTLKYQDIIRYDEWFVTKLVVDDGRVHGVVAVEIRTGRIETIPARTVILATGGCGRAFPFTTNAAIKTGDGMTLAYRAGAPLKDMEFVQYHPTGLPFTGILITEAARAEGGWLINKDGYRYLQDYDLGTPTPTPKLRSMELGPRDRLSQAFVHEQEKGRTVDTPYGPVVHLDLRHLGAGKIDARIPFVRELCRSYQNLDPATDLIPVRPVVHYMMGGVHTDIDGATPVAGLYAAGETACVSINGANRLGSNSLPEILVFGRRAGVAAAGFARSHRNGEPSCVRIQGADERRRLERARGGRGHGERIADLREEMQHTLEGAAGIYRTGDALAKAADTLAELRERAEEARVDDTSTTFNTELINLQELHAMLEIAQTIVACALNRRESRGAHQRTDFPVRDDEAFLAHSLVHRAPDGTPSVGLLPVTITRWPPGERVYGRD
ncbi:fumarate reductase (quinol) flavoprotein subunit [Nonomuraea mesophila]|uniref:Fumarate reductase flavoprotein subunit n=2 Tax=Nonomuraea mesophila TaxID=2530382 RepID=A0A4R5FFP0_9ACTN|nr:fumarate reductase (quinol) flavoprotein subunit [Nonomuraea mesophila]